MSPPNGETQRHCFQLLSFMGKMKRKNHQYRIGTERLLKLLLVLVIAAAAGYFTIQQKAHIIDPPGEYGQIQDPGTIVRETEPSRTDTEPVGSDLSGNAFLEEIPDYSGTPVYVMIGNRPSFTEEEYSKAESAFIELSELDQLGRCGACEASLGEDTLAGERDFDMSHVHPSGWKQAQYPDVIEENNSWLYNRSHLIMYAVSGLTDDERNLITGTEYMNVKGMLPYCEKATQNWLLRRGGRILYRATPIFNGPELICRGVHLEAGDVETRGEKFHINVFCYNVEPGIHIDYLTGESWPEE